MIRLAFVGLAVLLGAALPAHGATLGESAKALIGSWEFSNADRDKICTATFKPDPVRVGFKVDFDAKCAGQFPLVKEVAGWTFPDGDLLRLLDAQGRPLVEFSEVEDGIFEAPTAGIGILFLQNAASAGPPPKLPEEVAGDWTIVRGGKPVCSVTLTMTAVQDSLVMTVKPGCDATIARFGFVQWRMDRAELLLVSARGPWRFELIDNVSWRRLPETADQTMLVKQ